MENEKGFLETWKVVIDELHEERLVTYEEMEKGVDIPITWLYTSGLEREYLVKAIRNLYYEAYPDKAYYINEFKEKVRVVYHEKEGKSSIEVRLGEKSVVITEEKMESKESSKSVTTDDLISEIMYAKKQGSIDKLIKEENMPREQATIAVNFLFSDKQIQSDLYAMPHLLNEMAMNFGTYYRYMDECEIKDLKKAEEDEKKKQPTVIEGGIIEPAVDSNTIGPRGPIIGPKVPRKSEIYDFQQRDQIFQNLGPKLIVLFDGIDKKTREIIKNAHNCYVFENPQQNKGYLVISEPFQGDKEAQAFYLKEDFIKDLQEGHENSNEFWKELIRTYIEEMTRSQFAKEGKTYTFRHTGDIEEYRQKIEGVVNGCENNSQKVTVQRASIQLFGKYEYKDALQGVTRRRYNNAKRAIFGERENTQTNENEGETIDE